MGWSYQQKNWSTIKEFFDNMYRSSDESKIKFKVLDASLINRTEAYAAVEMENVQKGTKEIFAATFLVNFNRSYFSFGYKDMDESCGPNILNCPERIMKLLTPTVHEYAIKWRERMWEKINKRKELCKVLTVGSYFYLDDEIYFVLKRTPSIIYVNKVFIRNDGSYTIDPSWRYRLNIKKLDCYNIKFSESKNLELKLLEL